MCIEELLALLGVYILFCGLYMLLVTDNAYKPQQLYGAKMSDKAHPSNSVAKRTV